MSPVHLRDLGFQRHQPEEREGLSRIRRPGRGHLGHSGGCQALREIIPTLPFTFQFNRNLKPENWKDMDQVLQLHQLLKDLFQWSMDNKKFNLASHWEELGESCQNICLKEIDFRDLMVITKGWNPTRKFRLLEMRPNRIRENQATIQAIEEQLTQTGHIHIPFGLTRSRPNQLSIGFMPFTKQQISGQESPFFKISGISRRRQGYKGKNKTTFNQRKEESDPMI
ncbi:hypothetical protein O181_038276 [Austropuccinia psidii MF-1]|uniref:Uncharacterized protein n=1 Tax=Austropuccinia psidii MF-1 TaxID=1389203 RepID=A0A9Q3DDP6_9BASI|nr:hypothetical protein [Austropuccinia psidii MF-1]